MRRKPIYDSYTIIHEHKSGDWGVVVAKNFKYDSFYGVWYFKDEEDGRQYFMGEYADSSKKAGKIFAKRINDL